MASATAANPKICGQGTSPPVADAAGIRIEAGSLAAAEGASGTAPAGAT